MDAGPVLKNLPPRGLIAVILVGLGALMAAVAAGSGGHIWEIEIPRLDTAGRLFLGTLAVVFCCGGFVLAYGSGANRGLTFTFREILGDGAPDKHYDFRDLTTIDGLLDDIYRTALTGIVRPRSYAAEDGWILATKGGEALWNIGSDWAKRTGVLPAPGAGVPIDDRLVREMPWFRPGATLRVQRTKKAHKYSPEPEDVVRKPVLEVVEKPVLAKLRGSLEFGSSVSELRSRHGVRELLPIEDGMALSKLPRGVGVRGFTATYVIDTVLGRGDREPFFQRKPSGSICVEIHKLPDGLGCIVGYVSQEHYGRLTQPGEFAEITFLPDRYATPNKALAIPLPRIDWANQRQITFEDNLRDVLDMKVRL